MERLTKKLIERLEFEEVTSLVADRLLHQYFIKIEYADGSMTDFSVPGKCRAYLDTGFLVAADGKWLFYTPNGKQVAEREQSELGTTVYITSVGCYEFRKSPGTGAADSIVVDHLGKNIDRRSDHPLFCIPAEDEFPTLEEANGSDVDEDIDWEAIDDGAALWGKNLDKFDKLYDRYKLYSLPPRYESWSDIRHAFALCALNLTSSERGEEQGG